MASPVLFQRDCPYVWDRKEGTNHMEYITDARFDSAAALLPAPIGGLLLSVPAAIKRKTQEIRLRTGKPLAIGCRKAVYFIGKNGRLLTVPGKEAYIADKDSVQACFQFLCEYSVYSHENEIRQGFLSLRGGHRAGVCGTAVYRDGHFSGVCDISSICLRISRQMTGCSEEILKEIGSELSRGLLLAGAPSSGKTTVLRDLARAISSGEAGEIQRIAIVDERGELAGTYAGMAENDLGYCCDVLNGYQKAEGILQAVRALSPDYILCDEIGGTEEAKSLLQCLHAGVSIIASIHAGSPEEFLHRQQALLLLRGGAFGHVAFLAGKQEPGTIDRIYKAGDLLAQIHGNAAADSSGGFGRAVGIA